MDKKQKKINEPEKVCKLRSIDKTTILALIGAIKVMNIAASLYDQDKKAGAWLIMGAEVQKALNVLEA